MSPAADDIGPVNVPDLVFHRQGRSRTAAGLLAVIYVVLLAAITLLDAVWWIVALLVFPTLPAVWDLWKNPQSGLRLNTNTLSWWTGKRRASLNLAEIEGFRFDTRLDFSVRVTALLRNGKKLRLPHECLPPHRALESALQARDIPVRRHHFSLL